MQSDSCVIIANHQVFLHPLFCSHTVSLTIFYSFIPLASSLLCITDRNRFAPSQTFWDHLFIFIIGSKCCPRIFMKSSLFWIPFVNIVYLLLGAVLFLSVHHNTHDSLSFCRSPFLSNRFSQPAYSSVACGSQHTVHGTQVPVYRGKDSKEKNHANLEQVIKDVGEHRGISVIIFPEGTRRWHAEAAPDSSQSTATGEKVWTWEST